MWLIDTEGKYAPNLDDDGNPITTPHPMRENFFNTPGHPASSSYVGGFSMSLNYFTESKNVYGENMSTDSKILRQIEENISLEINTTFHDLSVSSNDTIFTALIGLGQSLLQSDRTGILSAMDALDAGMNKILSAQAINGSVINRFDSTLERNAYQQVETSRLQSDLEEADYAEVVSQYAVLQTVFQMALNSTARIMQTSLADYIR
jgi:flagellar hook-associated protein 3 FlgL